MLRLDQQEARPVQERHRGHGATANRLCAVDLLRVIIGMAGLSGTAIPACAGMSEMELLLATTRTPQGEPGEFEL